jgi:hypothetical protein
MTIEINIGGGWHEVPGIAVPDGFITAAHANGGFVIKAVQDLESPGWCAFHCSGVKGLAPLMRDDAESTPHRFLATAIGPLTMDPGTGDITATLTCQAVED